MRINLPALVNATVQVVKQIEPTSTFKATCIARLWTRGRF